MPKKKWPPPEFPIVEGDHVLTETWAIHLPDKFARRIEDGDLVLWRPGLTIWLTPWGNERSESQSKRLKAIKKHASPDRFLESESKTDRLTRYVYRLRDENENGIVESMFAHILNDDGHLQMAVYFDNPKDELKARALADSVTECRRA